METNPPGIQTIQTVPHLISQAIRQAGRTQKWTASEAGISAATFQRKLKGGGDFTTGEVHRIATALQVRASALLPDIFFSEVA